MTQTVTKCYRVYGIVQGVGFRPTVSRHAARCGITGSVSNKGPYVEIVAQGTPEEVALFRDLLEREPPRRAVILRVREIPVTDGRRYGRFSIIESEKTTGEIFISPDIAVCEDCRRELYDPENRRYLHPFINCTCCGPRMTILDALPYDRERTSMRSFSMCPDCRAEYEDPSSRRYDAQPVCCNDCGPQVYLIGTDIRGREAITRTRRIIRDGGIAAVKGIGGFHLCCDACSPDAVNLLRERKRRPMKPFAVMARDPAAAERAAYLTQMQREILDGHQKPILLLKRRKESRICEACAPENPKIGLMLPYAPLQLLLFDYDDGIEMPDYLVMTSANTSGAPICRDDEDAVRELSGLCDVMLSHDRTIRIRADDTVMDFYGGEPYMVRRSRGYAPLPVSVSGIRGGEVLAVGGELKNTFCVGVNDLFYLSPYVGDLEDVRTVKALSETAERFETLLEVHPETVACDTHPLYQSAAFARETGREVIEVQHHYAHVLSCMAENDVLSPVIGISYDGTGYGTDGSIWGGEILLADAEGFRRAAHIRPFFQSGGDAGAREGWRIAAGMLCEIKKDGDEAAETAEELGLCSRQELHALRTMAENRINTVRSTSCGRLFDAACAVLGIRRVSTFEGEAATALQFKAMEYASSAGKMHTAGDVQPQRSADGSLILPTERILEEMIRMKLCGAATAEAAWRFHRMLADMTVAAAICVREESGVNTAALTGGVFQNTLLLALCETDLKEDGFTVLRHHMVPPNDGGIALGQALAAALANQKKG